MNDIPDRDDRAAMIGAYKTILQDVLNRRPSGARQRLASALGKNRSFVSHISNPAYAVPIPAPHLDIIFEVCHFTLPEKTDFLEAFNHAHPNRIKQSRGGPSLRSLRLEVADLGDPVKNQKFDDLIRETARSLAQIIYNED